MCSLRKLVFAITGRGTISQKAAHLEKLNQRLELAEREKSVRVQFTDEIENIANECGGRWNAFIDRHPEVADKIAALRIEN